MLKVLDVTSIGWTNNLRPPIGYDVIMGIFLILLIVLFGFGIGTLLFSFALFTRLVRVLHDHYPDEWLHAGKPVGFLWRPSEYRSWHLFDQLRSGFATNWVAFAWIFQKPEWVKRNPDTERVFGRYRAAVLIWNLVCFPLLLLTGWMMISHR
jgi:hypothetical protein